MQHSKQIFLVTLIIFSTQLAHAKNSEPQSDEESLYNTDHSDSRFNKDKSLDGNDPKVSGTKNEDSFDELLNTSGNSTKSKSKKKSNDKSSDRSRNNFDWTKSVPFWIYSSNKSSFTISLGAYNFDNTYVQEVGVVSSGIGTGKISELKSHTNITGTNLELTYGFELPFFISLKTKSHFQMNQDAKIGDTKINNSVEKYNFDGLSEPELSFGGAWANPGFSIGGKVTTIFATDPHNTELFIANSGKQQIVSNNTSGGASNLVSVFSSYNFGNVLLDAGFTYVKAEKRNSVYTTTDYSLSTTNPTTTKTKGYFTGESSQSVAFGIEFPNAGKLGIHFANTVQSPYSYFYLGSANSNAKTETKHKASTLNSLSLSSKLKASQNFSFKPSLTYFTESGGDVDDPTNQFKSPKSTGYNLNLVFDFSF